VAHDENIQLLFTVFGDRIPRSFNVWFSAVGLGLDWVVNNTTRYLFYFELIDLVHVIAVPKFSSFHFLPASA